MFAFGSPAKIESTKSFTIWRLLVPLHLGDCDRRLEPTAQGIVTAFRV
jgi:hypothetical protein